MNTVAIYPESTASEPQFRAVAGERTATGKTAGQALDALNAQTSHVPSGPFLVISNNAPDRFFTLQQQHRLGELMNRWREARDAGRQLATHEQTELDELIAAELRGATERAQAIADAMRS